MITYRRYEGRSIEYTTTCPKCKKMYDCVEIWQTPGFRDREEEICPYCGYIVKTSMEIEFRTYKREE